MQLARHLLNIYFTYDNSLGTGNYKRLDRMAFIYKLQAFGSHGLYKV